MWNRAFHETLTDPAQRIKFRTEKHPCPGGIRTHNLSKRAAAHLRLIPDGNRVWHMQWYGLCNEYVILSKYSYRNMPVSAVLVFCCQPYTAHSFPETSF